MKTVVKGTPALFHFDMHDADCDRVLNPGKFFRRPADVVEDQDLALSEKRAILSSWASDACAVDSVPYLRYRPGTPTPVSFDDVMDALQSLDKPHAPKATLRITRSTPNVQCDA